MKYDQKILVIRFSSIGDIILATSPLKTIRAAYPEAQITFLTLDVFSPLLEFHPDIDALVTLSKKASFFELYSFRKYLKSKSYNMIFDPKSNKLLSQEITQLESKKYLKIYYNSFQKLNDFDLPCLVGILINDGKNLIKLKSNLSLSKNSIYSYLNTFATSDIYGNLVQIDTKGNVIKTPENLAPGHYIEMTTKTLVSLSENILTIKGIPVKLPYGNYTKPKIFYINNTIYVSTTDIDSQKVYLYLSNGKLVNGFPVYGSDSADIVNSNNKNSLEMIVQSESNGIIIYQIN